MPRFTLSEPVVVVIFTPIRGDETDNVVLNRVEKHLQLGVILPSNLVSCAQQRVYGLTENSAFGHKEYGIYVGSANSIVG